MSLCALNIGEKKWIIGLNVLFESPLEKQNNDFDFLMSLLERLPPSGRGGLTHPDQNGLLEAAESPSDDSSSRLLLTSALLSLLHLFLAVAPSRPPPSRCRRLRLVSRCLSATGPPDRLPASTTCLRCARTCTTGSNRTPRMSASSPAR